MKFFKAIAAVSENGVIGAHGKIPWHIPDEYRWFKKRTLGQTVVMGRKTYESLPGPLPNRRILVLSRQSSTMPGVTVFKSLDEIDPNTYEGEVFIAGGADVYKAALPRCDEIFLTRVKRTVEGDVYFPEMGPEFQQAEILQEHPEFTVYRYIRT